MLEDVLVLTMLEEVLVFTMLEDVLFLTMLDEVLLLKLLVFFGLLEEKGVKDWIVRKAVS